jgi:hypothetical protein
VAPYRVVPLIRRGLGLQGRIAKSGADEVKLIEILPSSEAFPFMDEDLDHVWCLIVAGGKFSPAGAIDWLKKSKSVNREAGRAVLPSAVLLVRTERLSSDDHYLISTGLRPTGALLCKWDRNAETVEAAFEALRVQLANSYGESDFDRFRA